MKLRNRFSRFNRITRNLGNLARLLGLLYVIFRKHFPVQRKLVLLESHHGAGFFGNPFYIAEYLSCDSNEGFAHLRLIVVCPRQERSKLAGHLGHRQGLGFCSTRSLKYPYYLAVAEFLISDVTFPVYFSRREGQQYLNTWHGTPLKTLGRRSATELFAFVVNTQRNFLHATHLLAPNRHTEKVLLEDFMIDKIWAGEVIRCGYPRNDVLVNWRNQRKTLPASELHVVFMPTWRGTLSTVNEQSEQHIRQLNELLTFLAESLPERVTLWVRLHPIIRKSIDLSVFSRIKPFPNDLEPYKHLAQCDVLVTDYSSVLFDFAVTGKPIILYTEDIEAYRMERDFCVELESLPFLRVTEKRELVRVLSDPNLKHQGASEAYKQFQKKYSSYETGDSTARISRRFLLGQDTVESVVIEPEVHKKNILIFAGPFLNNGITTSLKALLSLIDLDQINVILWINAAAAKRNSDKFFYELDRRISFIPTQNWLPVDPFDAFRVFCKDVFGKSWRKDDPLVRAIWGGEWNRLFGAARFDTVIHFSGYERSVFLLFAGCKFRKVVYMHNDMAKELQAGKSIDARALRLAYTLSDAIASVRDGAEIEYSKTYMDIRHKVVHVPNSLVLDCHERGKASLVDAFAEGQESGRFAEIARSLRTKSSFRFVNLARFSPEKGQKRLIEAFESFHAEYPNSELYIIGGYGPIRQEICNRAERSAARDSIFVVLGSSNPFPLVKQMNAMIFSSFYEGIGLVLYEAFSMAMPVISTDIPGPSELLRQGFGLVVPNTTVGLIEGMHKAVRGQVPVRDYDFSIHNEHALQQFYKLIEFNPQSSKTVASR